MQPWAEARPTVLLQNKLLLEILSKMAWGQTCPITRANEKAPWHQEGRQRHHPRVEGGLHHWQQVGHCPSLLSVFLYTLPLSPWSQSVYVHCYVVNCRAQSFCFFFFATG